MAVFLRKRFDWFNLNVMNLKIYSRLRKHMNDNQYLKFMCMFLCTNLGQGYIVYFYISDIWDIKKNTYERMYPDIMYSLSMSVEKCNFMSGFVSIVLHIVLHFKNKLEWRIDEWWIQDILLRIMWDHTGKGKT